MAQYTISQQVYPEFYGISILLPFLSWPLLRQTQLLSYISPNPLVLPSSGFLPRHFCYWQCPGLASLHSSKLTGPILQKAPQAHRIRTYESLGQISGNSAPIDSAGLGSQAWEEKQAPPIHQARVILCRQRHRINYAQGCWPHRVVFIVLVFGFFFF